MPISSAAYRRSTSIPSPPLESAQVGVLHLLEVKTGRVTAKRRVYGNQEIIIGRDKTRCQWSFDDPRLSAKQLRIYTVIYENEQDTRVTPLVYAEDLSRYGVYWNDSLIGKGNGGYLLSHEDKLRLSANVTLQFISPTGDSNDVLFDMTQEQEMNGFRDEYILTDRLLGAGADGRVFMAIEYATRSQVACKVIDLRGLKRRRGTEHSPARPVSSMEVDAHAQLYKVKVWADHHRGRNNVEDRLRRYNREVEILASITHPNIISVDKVFVTKNTIYLFQDLVTAGDLFSYMEMKNHKLLESEAAVIVRQITIALKFLHQKCIVHRDLKPDNIMVTSMATGARIVLADFGSARQVQYTFQRMASIVGTAGYAAPEVTNTNPVMRKQEKVGYTTAIDMWSLGVVTVLLITGISAFLDVGMGLYSAQSSGPCGLNKLEKTTEWKEVRKRPRDFISNLLVLDETKRMTSSQALAHSWFSNDVHKIDFENLYQRTIQGWHPRAVKSPVITFQGGVRHNKSSSTSSMIDPGRKLRDFQRPVEPPYIPFPRRMHTEFWPARKPRYLTSGEVGAAIAEKWSIEGRESQKTVSKTQFADLNELYKIAKPDVASNMSNSKSSCVDTEVSVSAPPSPITPQPDSIRSNQEGTEVRALNLALRPTKLASLPSLARDIGSLEDKSTQQEELQQRVVPAPDIEDLPEQLMQDEIQLSATETATCAGGRLVETVMGSLDPVQKSPTDEVMKSGPSQFLPEASSLLPETPTRPALQLKCRSNTPRVRRISSMSETRKRRRASIFDLVKDDESDSDEECNSPALKKARTSTLAFDENDNKEEHIVTPARRRSAMLDIELEPTKRDWHLPR